MTLEHLDTLIAFAVVMLGVSLIVTILTQMVSTLFGLRGTNLKWGLVQLLKTVHPEFEKDAEAIAQKVLTHPLVSDSTFSQFAPLTRRFPLLGRWQLASAVRVEEVVGALERLSGGAAPLPPGATPGVYRLEQAMATIAHTARQTTGPEVQAITSQVLELVQALQPAAAAAAAGGGTGTATVSLPAAAVRIEELIKSVPATAEKTLRDLKSWFEPAMDRVAQRFALHMRLWTVVFSIVVAFAIQLDAFKLLSQLSIDAVLRAKLVATSDTLVRKADEVKAGAAGASVEQLAKEATSIRTDLQAAQFQIVPDPYPAWDFGPGSPLANLHFWGIMASAGLLSLGAPFWFNALKGLSSLRPILAGRQEKEKSQTAAA